MAIAPTSPRHDQCSLTSVNEEAVRYRLALRKYVSASAYCLRHSLPFCVVTPSFGPLISHSSLPIAVVV
jgi:hypothetical protein